LVCSDVVVRGNYADPDRALEDNKTL
jgi:hypothetical protein